MRPFSSLDTLVSRKLTDVSLISAVNLIVLSKELKAYMKESKSSRECCHIMNMSSIYLHQTSGISFLVDRKSLSSLSINKMAKFGAHFVPILVPETCS